MSPVMLSIVEHDKSLAILRQSWRDAIPARKSHWMGLINQALDERLKLMKARDEEAALGVSQPSDITTDLLIALQDCVAVMEEELAGMKVIQPELEQARAVIARATGKEGAE